LLPLVAQSPNDRIGRIADREWLSRVTA